MSKTVTDEKTYITESLDFINTNKTNFSPLLTSIAKKMNEDKELIGAMTTAQNSNLKELIVKLTEKDSTKGDFTKYVEQCLRIMGIPDSKNNIYELLNLVIQDLKANADLMEKVNKFKKDNTEWNKMVDMLRAKNELNVPNAEGEAPPVAQGEAKEGEAKEGEARPAEEGEAREARPAGEAPAVGEGEATAEGKAQGRQPTGEGEEAPVAATGTPPTGKATSLDDVKVELDGGGQQRLTRKQKNSIGTARKTRTNR